MTNKELIEYYTQYEEVLENAISLSFIHLTYGEFMDIVKYYEDMIGCVRRCFSSEMSSFSI